MENNSVVILTGASGGIGRATALKFAEKGCRLVLVDLEHMALEAVAGELAALYDTECLVCAGDLAEGDFLNLIVEQTVAKWGRVDVLINNAAWRTLETMRTMSRAVWERTLKVCLTAPAFLSRQCAEIMERIQEGGVIINVSSVMSARAGGSSPAYIAAKGALDSLTYELAVTYGRSNIRVVGVQPGFIETELSSDYLDPEGANISNTMTAQMIDMTPLARGGTAAEVAEAIFWLSAENAAFISGTTLLIDGGFKHNMSSYAIKKIQFPKEY
ncbi:SDR family NAD(P)-dependent oxidoreductase [Pedobacter heparinus]|uniref:Short-chain dehydrogenase/reductase SDR n=1 Tax=Pedobacter heparinus (strain ATCC 13125 / DSM 2366 / CIP 104194 / JCM 7457 / NBRC 12017 / NCIMB 9290 / NRRL B-14731 / HIM 762-3) TaxID=485917 RepID=C6XTI8_PEDHD|nr:SDR family oxidoreductase [Pedobacter heparinus]ACU05766.1 short-chain dehydrogenase/reductase SDR [Pedobacter heparinus DSM 2366]